MLNHTFHFLNVKDGDCSIIVHGSGHVSVIDVCNARAVPPPMTKAEALYLEKRAGTGNFQQKKYPVNPLDYLQKFGITSVFRFILTHPDMDHMDGIADLWGLFSPSNMWDTDNDEDKDFSEESPYREEDWQFYVRLRDENPQTNPKRLTLFSGDDGKHRTRNWDDRRPGDAMYVLAPTPKLVAQANKTGNYNDASFVILYHSAGGRILLSGDAHDATWEHLLETLPNRVQDVDLLIAPHHGRASGRSYSFLNVVNPKMTFFGNARSEHLAYDAWNRRNLEYITNNQANCMVVDCAGDRLTVYVTCESFARAKNPLTFYSERLDAWYLKEIQ